jgi:hypothetical protein
MQISIRRKMGKPRQRHAGGVPSDASGCYVPGPSATPQCGLACGRTVVDRHLPAWQFCQDIELLPIEQTPAQNARVLLPVLYCRHSTPVSVRSQPQREMQHLATLVLSLCRLGIPSGRPRNRSCIAHTASHTHAGAAARRQHDQRRVRGAVSRDHFGAPHLIFLRSFSFLDLNSFSHADAVDFTCRRRWRSSKRQSSS